jgi:dihydroorotase
VIARIENARHWRTGQTITLAYEEDTLAAGGRGRVVAPGRAGEAGRLIDARGLVLAPGLVDLHVHLREPGQAEKETIESGTAAAAAGGFTAVACMPNTRPVVDSADGVAWVLARARASGRCRVHPLAAVSVGQRGERLTDVTALRAAGAVALSDDGRPVASAALMRRALEGARAAGLPIVCHEEDPTLAAGGCMNEGPVATRLGLPGLPAAAETVMARRDIELAALTGGHVHLAHLSCRDSLAALRDAKGRGLPVSGETCPHYWMLTDEAVAERGADAKMNPPLRAAADRDAVIAAIADGTLDVLVTDHAPHTPAEKLQTVDRAPFGIVGLETALALTITGLVRPGHLTLERALALWTEAPRRLFGLPEVTLEPGSPADLVLLDPAATWRVDPAAFRSRGRSTPFAGATLAGRALLTVCGGEITHLDPAVRVARAPGARVGAGA